MVAPGIALSETQVAAIHPKPPVLAADGDPSGGGATVAWPVALAKTGRESVIVDWPAGEDPASRLAAHGAAGLDAITRKGCQEGAGGALRPHHSGAEVAARLVGHLSPAAGLEDRWRAGLAPTTRMGAARYATAASEVLAPVVVAAAAQAVNNDPHRVHDVIGVVASYGRRLPEVAQAHFVERAAYEIERAGLAPAGWAQRRIEGGMEDRHHLESALGEAVGHTRATGARPLGIEMHPAPPVLGFDGDWAGQDSAYRHALAAARQGRTLGVTVLPDDHDPASWLAEQGDDGLKAWERHEARPVGWAAPAPVDAVTYVAGYIGRQVPDHAERVNALAVAAEACRGLPVHSARRWASRVERLVGRTEPQTTGVSISTSTVSADWGVEP